MAKGYDFHTPNLINSLSSTQPHTHKTIGIFRPLANTSPHIIPHLTPNPHPHPHPHHRPNLLLLGGSANSLFPTTPLLRCLRAEQHVKNSTTAATNEQMAPTKIVHAAAL